MLAQRCLARRLPVRGHQDSGVRGRPFRGRQAGGNISFDLREQAKDRAGSDVRIGARILLVGDSIRLIIPTCK